MYQRSRSKTRWTIGSALLLINLIIFTIILSLNIGPNSGVECKKPEPETQQKDQLFKALLKRILFGNLNTKKNTQPSIADKGKTQKSGNFKPTYQPTPPRNHPSQSQDHQTRPQTGQQLNTDPAKFAPTEPQQQLQLPLQPSTSSEIFVVKQVDPIESMIDKYNSDSHHYMLQSNNKLFTRRNGYSSSYTYEPPCYGFPLEINIRSRIKPEDVFPIRGNSQFKKCIKLDQQIPTPDNLNLRLNFKPTPSPEPYPSYNYGQNKYLEEPHRRPGVHYDE